MKKLNFLNNSKNLNQISKLLVTSIICVILILAIELIFKIPSIAVLFSGDNLVSYDGLMLWVALWVIMFAQVTIIPIPPLPIYIVCNSIPYFVGGAGIEGLFSGRTLFFCLFVTSACLAGCILAYWLGRLGGKKAVTWIAGSNEDFDHWVQILNKKGGKMFYAATVLFPVFPDDLLAIIAGSLKLDFKFYVLVNFIGKFIGAFFTLLLMRMPIINNLFLINPDEVYISLTTIVYSALILLCIVLYIICRRRIKKLNVEKTCIDNREINND